MKTKLLALILVAGSSLFGRSHFGFCVGFGYPYAYPHYVPPPAPMVYYAPPAPRYGYTWIDGYWYPAGPRWVWRSGYWARPLYRGAYWVRPRYVNRIYYRGYWRRR
jgi:hypothetical protein